MMGPLRNPATKWQMIAFALVEAAICLGAWICAGAAAAAFAGAAGLAALALHAAFAFARSREIMRLVAEMDEVLHGGRRVDFSNCREGDVEVLRCELGKMIARMGRLAELLEREKSTLADTMADVSHQIRTPLTAISLTLPLIERAETPEERARLLRELEQMVDRVSWLVVALLKMAKLDAGAMHLANSTVNAEAAVRAALRPLEIPLELHDVSCTVSVQGAPLFKGDAAWTAEALENIVKNCMEHTPAGGAIGIHVSEDAAAVRIRIADTGPGIAEADLPHIFERFYRGTANAGEATGSASKADERIAPGQAASALNNDALLASPFKAPGFGIGLALAQSLVSAQGGSLRASNGAQGGAQFDIAFPKLVI